MTSQPHDTVPGVEPVAAAAVVEALEHRLVALLDLHLTLKHVHWNVVGPSFLSVHEMMDAQVGPVRDMSDAVAERIRTLGGVPKGTPAAIVETRWWDDYPLLTESVYVHLKKLDGVYAGVISDHRAAIGSIEGLDPVTEDLLVTQTGQLELFQWFIRSFVQRAGGSDEVGHVGPAAGAADRRDGSVTAGPDRPPTDEERRAAERGSADVDLEEVGSHQRQMSTLGANVKGEGRI